MASLTPGTLQKLLQNAGNKDFKVAGEHRSPLLQVISIVPSLGDDPWKSRGFYLRVSDSLHSAYVSVSDEDVELILSDKVQLGQFVHVSWLDSGSPVPILRGIKPIPKRRPCVGDPKDLISSDFLNAKKGESKVKCKKRVVKNDEVNVRRLSFGNGKVKGGVECRRLSLDSARKGWDSNPDGKGPPRPKLPKSDYPVVVKKAEDSPRNFRASSKNVVVSPKPVKNMKPLPRNSESRLEPKMLWDHLLPSTICNLGKEVARIRNLASASAVDALEEASVSDSVISCMSAFAQLCELSRKDSAGPLLEQFFRVHETIKNTTGLISSLMTSNKRESNNKNAWLWVQAAVKTELSNFTLYARGGEKGHCVMIEAPVMTKRSTKVATRPTVQGTTWVPGSGLKQAANLAETLLSSSCMWFLDYLEKSLDNGFGLRRDHDGSQTMILLGQLKRVDQWLDDAVGEGDDERIGRLKKKLYGFLLNLVANSQK